MGVFFGKRATKYAQGVFYRSLSRPLTGLNREVFPVSSIWYIGKRPCCAVSHLTARLRAILRYQEGLEVVQHDDAFEDDEMRFTASNSE